MKTKFKHKLCKCKYPHVVDSCAGCLKQMCRCGGVSAEPAPKEKP